jgi:hypothetical protein
MEAGSNLRIRFPKELENQNYLRYIAIDHLIIDCFFKYGVILSELGAKIEPDAIKSLPLNGVFRPPMLKILPFISIPTIVRDTLNY